MKTHMLIASAGILLFLLAQLLVAQDDCQQVKSIDFVDENNGWVATDNGLLITQDGGSTWSYHQSDGPWENHNIDFLNNEIGWAVRDHTILKTVDGGLSWVKQRTFGEIPYGPGFPHVVDDRVIFVASDREVLKTTDGGINWKIIDLNMELTSLWFFNEDQGIVPGEENGCMIKKTSDGGNTWESQFASGIHEIYSLSFINDSLGYFIPQQGGGVDNEGPLYTTADTMNTWEFILADVRSYSATTDGTVFALTQDATMMIKKRMKSQQEWETVWSGISKLRFIKFLDENTGWAIGDDHVLKTTDGGLTWLDLPGYPGADYCAPTLVATGIHIQPDSIEALNSEDGMIYLVPEQTDQNLSIIQSLAIDSIEAVANQTAKIPVSVNANGRYWMYATDTSQNISEHVEILIIGKDIDLSDIVLMNDLAFLNALIEEGVDTTEDGLISYSEAEAITSLDVGPYWFSRGISDMTGIETFINLDSLICHQNELTALDVSKNTALTVLWCSGNQITSLDVSKNTNLTELRCEWNQITNLDLSNSIALEKLECERNQLTSLDVSNNTSLRILDCGNNQLSDLDLTNNIALEGLDCKNNQLTNLDLSNNTASKDLDCKNNQLTNLDLSNISALEDLGCGNNQLTNLDLSNNTALKDLDCENNQLSDLDLSNNIALEGLDCANNQLTNLDLSNNTMLLGLYCERNQLTSLDVSHSTELRVLHCGRNAMTSLDVSQNTGLQDLDCSWNELTSLDVSNNIDLGVLDCVHNHLTGLDVTKNTRLWMLLCGISNRSGGGFFPQCICQDTTGHSNKIPSLDLSKCTELEALDCSSNPLVSLDLTNNTDLSWICLCSMETLNQVCLSPELDPPFWAHGESGIDTTGSPNVYFSTECITKIEAEYLAELSLYPNPANDLLTIEMQDPDHYAINIISLNGQQIFSGEMEGTTHQLNLSSFHKGVYFITIRSKDFVATRKIIKL